MARTIDHRALPKLKAEFPDLKLMAGEFRDMVTVIVPREFLFEVCLFLRDEPTLKYDMLAEMNSVDYLNYPGATHRFGVNYGLTSVDNNSRLWLRVYLDPEKETAPKTAPRDEDVIKDGDPGLKVDSVVLIWPGAEWLEREVYDMMGVIFVGNPDLRRILTWSGFGSYPLRKDYPMRGVGERENYKIVTRQGA
jgi:NADH-quinone oxidoreductase subunit C